MTNSQEAMVLKVVSGTAFSDMLRFHRPNGSWQIPCLVDVTQAVNGPVPVSPLKHDGDELLFMSSADWMSRNLNRRIELMVPVTASDCKNRLNQILDSYFSDNVAATELQTDGAYEPIKKKKKSAFRAQQHLQNEAEEIFAASNSTGSVFETHRKK